MSVKQGGFALVHTGNTRCWDDAERYLAGPGLSAGASRWLAGKGVLAVGADDMD